jgi:hypothetical protein
MSSFKSNANPMFRSRFSEDIFNLKYSHPGADTWEELSHTLIEDVCGNLRSGERDLITRDERPSLRSISVILSLFLAVAICTMPVGRIGTIITASFLKRRKTPVRIGPTCHGSPSPA